MSMQAQLQLEVARTIAARSTLRYCSTLSKTVGSDDIAVAVCREREKGTPLVQSLCVYHGERFLFRVLWFLGLGLNVQTLSGCDGYQDC